MEPETIEEIPYEEHLGANRQYLRDVMLGVNDGLVSIFLLVVGVVGGGLDSGQVLLAGIAGALAGAVSMASGEYIATKSQEEVIEGEMALERRHFQTHRPRELDELREMLGEFGLEGDLLEQVVAKIDEDDESLMKAMLALEFGAIDTERRSPIKAMLLSGIWFAIGSLPAILPFVFVDSADTGLWIAAVLSSIGLFAVGITKTKMTRGRPIVSGLENLGVAAVGAAVSYGIGSFVGSVT